MIVGLAALIPWAPIAFFSTVPADFTLVAELIIKIAGILIGSFFGVQGLREFGRITYAVGQGVEQLANLRDELKAVKAEVQTNTEVTNELSIKMLSEHARLNERVSLVEQAQGWTHRKSDKERDR